MQKIFTIWFWNSWLKNIEADMKIFKSSGIFMAVVLIFLLSYYFIVYKNKPNPPQANNQPLLNTADTSKTLRKQYQFTNDTTVTIEFLTGKFNPAKDTNFIEVDEEYANRRNIYLLKETYQAFIKMYYAAQNEGVKLKIISGTRNFNYQKSIWEQKWNGSRLVEGKNLAATIKDTIERARIILKYSSMPGTSRHHWGTDIDLNSMENNYFDLPEGKKVYEWLCNYASKYGFCQPFITMGDSRKTGYQEEKWHWSYMPLSKVFLNEYRKKVTYSSISEFSGSKAAKELDVITNYVMSINEDCVAITY